MTNKEMLLRLAEQQKTLNALAEMAGEYAEVARDADETGLAFSVLMVQESILAYAAQVRRFVLRVADRDEL